MNLDDNTEDKEAIADAKKFILVAFSVAAIAIVIGIAIYEQLSLNH